ncbi:MAG: DNA repair protein RadC [Clostridiales bacterium]|nr:DNA repair protein RadC [Clostridiales bacterium]
MSIKIKELPLSERPYEKMEMYGPENLSNAELLAIIIKTGTKEETSISVAQRILNINENIDKKNLRFLQELSIEEFMKIKGIGRVKAIQLKAIGELTKRISTPINKTKIKICNSIDVANFLMEELRYEKRELAKVIILNNKNVVQRVINVSLGGSNFACIEPKEVLTEAIKMQAPKIILVHNHPSGDSTPSEGDFLVTDRVYEAASIMGIELLDHIVIGDGTFESILTNKKGEER